MILSGELGENMDAIGKKIEIMIDITNVERQKSSPTSGLEN